MKKKIIKYIILIIIIIIINITDFLSGSGKSYCNNYNNINSKMYSLERKRNINHKSIMNKIDNVNKKPIMNNNFQINRIDRNHHINKKEYINHHIKKKEYIDHHINKKEYIDHHVNKIKISLKKTLKKRIYNFFYKRKNSALRKIFFFKKQNS